jgi:hypothetical protein
MAIARKKIDLEDGFLEESPGATFASDHSASRMIVYGDDETLRALDVEEDDDEDEYDEEDEDDDEEDDDEEEEDDEEDDDDEDEDEGEEIDDEEEEEIEGDDPDQVRIPGSSRVYRSL